MMTIEKFKEELFEKLFNVRKMHHDRLFVVGKDKFSSNVDDIRVFMDSEMQHLITLSPYSFSYVISASDADHLAFLDIVPDIRESEHEVEWTNYFYDSEKRRVCTFVTIVNV